MAWIELTYNLHYQLISTNLIERIRNTIETCELAIYLGTFSLTSTNPGEEK